jgi:ubiquinone/menaquinone biosynthesis C-methylase UbiE
MADFLNVDQVLHYLDIKDTMTAVEFGCGSADFTVALAKKITKGRVYALDIQEERISFVKNKLALEKLSNVSTILCDLEAPRGSTLSEKSSDIVLIPNVLFQAENKYAMIEEAVRILKSGGQLLIVDWVKKNAFGPREGLLSQKEAKKIADELGLSFI